jgi:hypothetical protein
VDLPGGEGDERIGRQAEQLRPGGSACETAAELPGADARDANRQCLAQARSGQEGQMHMIAYTQAADVFVQLDIVDALTPP